MVKPLKGKIKNNKKKEFRTWQTLIQPIIDAYGINGIEYKFTPVEHDLADRIKMERLTCQLCNGRDFNSFQELLIKWQNGTSPIGKFSYKTLFIEFMTHLHEESTLPLFLEFLSRDVEETKQSSEDFIRNLRVFYENDDQIKIQEPGKSPKPVTCQTMQFKNNTTKEWKSFIKILQAPPHTYYLGPANEMSGGIKKPIHAYDRKRKILGGINRKLIDYFNTEFKMRIPRDYKLYEKCETEKSGIYKFKFRVILDDAIKSYSKNKYEKKSVDELIKVLSGMFKEDLSAPSPTNKPQMTAISNVLISKYGFTETEIKEMLKPEQEEIVFDPHENVVDLDQDS